MNGTGPFLLGLLLQSASAVEPVEQVPSAQVPQAREVVDQISPASRTVEGSARPTDRDSGGPAQVSDNAAGRQAPPQLSRAERSAPATSQLNRGGLTAQAPEALSSPTQGRRGDQAAVGGRDRCDRADLSAAARAACARALETRAAEFARPDPATLSPEQRILVEQRLREAPAGGRALTRRMAEDAAANPNDPDNQEVAAIVLGRPGTPSDSRDREPTEDTDAQAEAAAVIIQAIINGGNGPR